MIYKCFNHSDKNINMAVDIYIVLIKTFADNVAQNNESESSRRFDRNDSRDNNSRFPDEFQQSNNSLNNRFTTQRSSRSISTLSQELAATVSLGNISKGIHFFRSN